MTKSQLRDKYVPQALYSNYKQQRQTLKTVQPNSFSKTPITIRVNLLQFGPSLTSFVFAVLFKPFANVLEVISMFPLIFSSSFITRQR